MAARGEVSKGAVAIPCCGGEPAPGIHHVPPGGGISVRLMDSPGVVFDDNNPKEVATIGADVASPPPDFVERVDPHL